MTNKELSFEKEQIRVQSFYERQLKKLEHRKNKLIQLLEDCLDWENVHHEGDLLKAHLGLIKKGMDSITVLDWKTGESRAIQIDPLKHPKDEMATRFRRAKKLQKGFIPLQGQLNLMEELIIKTRDKLDAVIAAKSLEELLPLKPEPPKPPKPKGEIAPVLPYHEFESSSGFKIWVGKSAKANDRLTFQLTNGNDWWLHVSGYSGSHVVIKTGNRGEPDRDTLFDAMLLAIYYSKARDRGEGEVCVTQKKYVTRLAKDKPGKVQVSKHKTIWARLDAVRLEELRGRK